MEFRHVLHVSECTRLDEGCPSLHMHDLESDVTYVLSQETSLSPQLWFWPRCAATRGQTGFSLVNLLASGLNRTEAAQSCDDEH